MKNIFKWTALLSCFVIMFCESVSAQVNKNLEQVIQQDLNALNSICPREVEKGVILNGARLLPQQTVEYSYTLKNFDSKAYNVTKFQNKIIPALKDSLKANSKMQALRDNQVRLSFVFTDKNGSVIHKFKLLPNEY
ncbi:MAG: hypothetical protein LBE20_04590 [Deltaproteobacteria bacterium]|jgi:hypothetical protein|nr:hypothetical protein [Deltaproteobacteria bacterium]